MNKINYLFKWATGEYPDRHEEIEFIKEIESQQEADYNVTA